MENTETVEIVAPDVPVVAEVEEVPAEPIAPTDDVPAEIAEDAPTEEVAEEAPTEEVVEAKTEEAPVESTITFNATEDATVFADKETQLFDMYDLSDAPELKSYIDTLKAKAEAVTVPEIFTQIADYGDVEAVTTLLDEHNTLYSRREENGVYRPNTDRFVETVVKKDQATADHLYFDLASQPSAKYQGINKFEEGIAEALAVEGESVATVLNRYHTAIKQLKQGATFNSADIPAFIPSELYPAFNTLPKETREEMQYWDEETYATERANQINVLRNIQKGIDADVAEQQRTVQYHQQRQQQLVSNAVDTQTKFYGEMRKAMVNKLASVQFSPDPKINKLLSTQQVTVLSQAFLDDGDGEFARTALSEAGITFDFAKAQTLVQEVNNASNTLAMEKNSVDANGRPLNPVALNKAQSAFKTITEKWLNFADNILKQQKELATTGTAKAIEAEVEKRKVAPKARPAVKALATAATNNGELKPPSHIMYGSPAWDKWYANQHMAAEAQKAQAYT